MRSRPGAGKSALPVDRASLRTPVGWVTALIAFLRSVVRSVHETPPRGSFGRAALLSVQPPIGNPDHQSAQQVATSRRFESSKSSGMLTHVMERPIYQRVETPNPLFDWFPAILETVKQIGDEIQSWDAEGGILTIRTKATKEFIPLTIRVRRTPEGFLMRWTYSNVPRVGFRQRFTSGWGEEPNRFVVVFQLKFKARFRTMKPAEGEAALGLPSDQALPSGS